MRVAYLLPDPGIPVGGTKGASVHVSEVCTALARRGHEVLLCAQRVSGSAPAGVHVAHLDPGPLPKGLGADTGRLRAAMDFGRRSEPLVRAFAPDLVYERLSLMYAGSARLATALGVPRLLEVNAPVVDEWSRHRPLNLRGLATELESRAVGGAEVVAVSAPLAGWARERGGAHTTVVTNGVDVQRFRPPTDAADAADRHELRAVLGLAGCDVVGFVGSLKPWHGVEVLVAAVAGLVPERPSVRLLIVGDGPQRASLVGQVARLGLRDQVVFTGAVPAAAVPRYVAALDVATAPFLPSKSFYFSPLKVAEAMACGRAVVASRLGPIEAMGGAAVVLVAPGDAAVLGAALGGLLADPTQRAAMGDSARRLARDALSWDGVVQRTLAAAERAPAGTRAVLTA